MKLLVIGVVLGCVVISTKAAPMDPRIRWCLKSEQEAQKCRQLASKSDLLSCVKREGSTECI
ncbi:hypothetical protein AMELA_G00212550, partial [Ameiurus melas]